METFDAINTRKSIRKYQEKEIPQAILDKILTAAILSTSGKNKQPWKFYVVRGEKRAEMVQEMQKGMDRLEAEGINTGSARYTIRVMAQAPVTILVFNPFSRHPLLPRNTQEIYGDMVDIQSVGARSRICCWKPLTWALDHSGFAMFTLATRNFALGWVRKAS